MPTLLTTEHPRSDAPLQPESLCLQVLYVAHSLPLADAAADRRIRENRQLDGLAKKRILHTSFLTPELAVYPP